MALRSTIHGGAVLLVLLLVLGALEMTLFVSSRFVGLGCYDPLEAAPQTASRLERLVDAYEGGKITQDEFRDAIAAIADPGVPARLDCDISGTTVLAPRSEPYRIVSNISVRPGAILVIQPGAEIILASDARLTVSGRLYAIGSQNAPIRFRAVGSDRYGEIRLKNGPNRIVWSEFDRGRTLLYVEHYGVKRTVIEKSRFNNWRNVAIEQRNYDPFHVLRWYLHMSGPVLTDRSGAGGLEILQSKFGLETPREETSEVIRSRWTDRLTIAESEFGVLYGYNDAIDLQDCLIDSWPLIYRNRFYGGEDDAIDVDECSAFVVGNLIQNFRPRDLSGHANGGGVTGAGRGSRPVIVNNIIDGNFHGIGFKDGARPVIINNTVINNNIGVAVYQSEAGAPMPHAILINNILWKNVSWRDAGVLQNIVTNGKWWHEYLQDGDKQGTFDAVHNIISGMPRGYRGERNRDADPLLTMVDGSPTPVAGSPAIDSGLGDLSVEDAPMDEVLKYLSMDYRGVPRRREGRRFVAIDRGAVEASPSTLPSPRAAP